MRVTQYREVLQIAFFEPVSSSLQLPEPAYRGREEGLLDLTALLGALFATLPCNALVFASERSRLDGCGLACHVPCPDDSLELSRHHVAEVGPVVSSFSGSGPKNVKVGQAFRVGSPVPQHLAGSSLQTRHTLRRGVAEPSSALTLRRLRPGDDTFKRRFGRHILHGPVLDGPDSWYGNT